MTSVGQRCDEEEEDEEEDETASSPFNLANIQFPDDFDEFLARADSGGSTYGLLKRHAFAASSLRERPTTAAAELQRPAQRQRSKSLIPPPQAEATKAATAADEKTLIKALCEHTAAAAAAAVDRGEGPSSSLQPLPVTDHRRRSTSAVLSLAAAVAAGYDPRKRVSYALTSPEFPGGGGGGPRGQPPPQVLVQGPGAADEAAVGGVATVPFCRRRSFSVTPRGGLVNEGDEVVAIFPSEMLMMMTAESGIQTTDSRRSSYNGGEGEGGGGGGGGGQQPSDGSSGESPVHKVLMLGGPGVGKTAITQQFLTSEFMAAQNTSFDDGREITVPVLLDGEESIMQFIDLPYSGDLDVWREYDVDGYIIVYSITDRRSYQKASVAMGSIRDCAANDCRPVILVANKSDLERSRMIGKEEGKCLAQNNDCKYIEVSAILNHKIDDLLVGTLKQIRLRSTTSSSSQQQQQQQQQPNRGHRRRSTIASADPNSPTIDPDPVSIGSTVEGGDRAGGGGGSEEEGGRSLGCLLTKSCRNGMFAKLFKTSKKISSKSCENLLIS